MIHCRECGTQLDRVYPSEFERTRNWCPDCQAWRYDHPSIMLTCFIACGSKLLWIQRKLDPRSGFWAIPGGFMESGEALAEGAARELYEETGIRLSPSELHFYMTGTITFINQVYVAFRATVESDHCEAGEEALQAAFYSREECPWDQVAYPEVNDSIRQAYDDLENGRYQIYQGQMTEEIYTLDSVKLTSLDN